MIGDKESLESGIWWGGSPEHHTQGTGAPTPQGWTDSKLELGAEPGVEGQRQEEESLAGISLEPSGSRARLSSGQAGARTLSP